MKTLWICCFLIVTMTCNSQVKVRTGTIQRFENFDSQYIPKRNVDVWLPDGYSTKEKYAVLYMQDGQMLFDPTTTWNGQTWKADEVAGKLIAEGKIRKFIIVGIWNLQGKRHHEYFPQKPYESLTATQKDTVTAQLRRAGRTKDFFAPYSDLYLKFVVEEVKPFIDSNFSTLSDQANTFIAGSSMGGLISLYALCEYPNVFGGAACLSTHWPGTFTMAHNPMPEAFYAYLRQNLPNPETHKVYFDYGDQTLDALYPPLQQKVNTIMLEKGFTAGNWTTQFFPGKSHSKEAWAERLHIPLEFLLKK